MFQCTSFSYKQRQMSLTGLFQRSSKPAKVAIPAKSAPVEMKASPQQAKKKSKKNRLNGLFVASNAPKKSRSGFKVRGDTRRTMDAVQNTHLREILAAIHAMDGVKTIKSKHVIAAFSEVTPLEEFYDTLSVIRQSESGRRLLMNVGVV
jgi:hypothetical protein